MPFALIIVGILLLVSSVKNTTSDLFTLVVGDFTGTNSFVHWFFAIMIIGALGYIDALRPLSRAFLALVIIVLFLSNKGFFSQINSEI